VKKTLLFLTGIVFGTMVFFGCNNDADISGGIDVTQKEGWTSGVAANRITAEALPGGILVKWATADNAASYEVYRREIGSNNNPVNGTHVQLGSGDFSSQRNLPYYVDAQVTNGTRYQYGIAARGYRYNTLSAIVWQSANFVSLDATTINAINDTIRVVSLPAIPTGSVTKINTSIPSAGIDYIEAIQLTVTGLTLGYNYTFRLQESTDGINWSTDTYIGSVNYPAVIDSYVDNGSLVYQSNRVSVYPSYANNPENWRGRIVVTITGANNTYIVVTNATTGLSSNQRVIVDPFNGRP